MWLKAGVVGVAAITLILGIAASCVAEKSPDGFSLADGDRVVFFGDSITQAGLYVEYVDAFLLTRFADQHFTLFNRGISSETLSGTSEPDHDPPRPDAHERFARDIVPLNPNVLVACFGMNDGNYHPFDEKLFLAYKAGMRRLIRRTTERTEARLVFLTPPPFDPYRGRGSDRDARFWGYKYPYIRYDEVLGRYSDWLLTLGDESCLVVDVHEALNAHIAQRRRKKVSFHLAGDGVHPNPTGHWLMAQTLLLAWGSPAEAGSVSIDARSGSAAGGHVDHVRLTGNRLLFEWRTGLPMPMDPRWDGESVALERVGEKLNRHTLQVTGLTGKYYDLYAEDVKVGRFAGSQLGNGIDLLRHAAFPTVRDSGTVLKLVQQRRRLLYQHWRKSLRDGTPVPVGITAKADELLAEIRALCKPKPLHIRLEGCDQ